MRTFDPSFVLLFLLAMLAAAYAGPAASQAATDAPDGVTFASDVTGLRVTLPAAWAGAESVSESELPGRATYRWEASRGPLAGAVLVVERVVGLNPLMEERWRRGQVAAGYYGFRPTGSVASENLVFGPGAAFELAAGGRMGRVFFVQRGQVFWSVHVSAPEALAEAVPPLLDGLATGVRLSDKMVAPAQISR